MIVELHEELAKALLTTNPKNLPADLIEAQEIAPEWMKEFILQGAIMCINREDWEEIPAELLSYVKTIRP